MNAVALSWQNAYDLVAREAAFLDERQWDDWLALFTPDCEYWVPAWIEDDVLTSNPHQTLSHIYYNTRAGLEDRIVRVRSGRSPASTPLRRTTHMVSNIVVLDDSAAEPTLRTSWSCHVFEVQHRKSSLHFGSAHYRLRHEQGAWRIAAKKTILQNDYMPSVVDVYCI